MVGTTKSDGGRPSTGKWLLMFYVAADNNHLMANGELLVSYFQVSLNDDGRIFTTAINDRDQLVLYEFDPVF